MNRRWDEPVQNSRCADQRSEQAGSASAVPGAQDHRRQRKLVDGGALRQRKLAPQDKRQAGQRQGKAIALEQVSKLWRQVRRETGASPRRMLSISSMHPLTGLIAADRGSAGPANHQNPDQIPTV